MRNPLRPSSAPRVLPPVSQEFMCRTAPASKFVRAKYDRGEEQILLEQSWLEDGKSARREAEEKAIAKVRAKARMRNLDRAWGNWLNRWREAGSSRETMRGTLVHLRRRELLRGWKAWRKVAAVGTSARLERGGWRERRWPK